MRRNTFIAFAVGFFSFLLDILAIPSFSSLEVLPAEKSGDFGWSSALLGLALLVLFIILLINVRRRRMSEIALKVSEDKFSKIFRSSPDWIAILRLSDGIYLDVNDAYLKMTGYEHQEVIGKSALEIGIYARPEERDS
jgi:PAS domain-containing protein